MASPQIPFSNVAGNNQHSPMSMARPMVSGPGTSAPAPIPGSPQAQASKGGISPYALPGSPNTTYTPPNTSASQGFITNGTDSGQNALQKQLNDIYGAGVGGSLFSLLNNMSGTDSTILQEYIQSLQPQMASAQSNVNAALGAGGVSANSSVSALADANLQSQEFSSIASESAALTQNQEQMTAQILEGTESASAKEVASSGWSIFGDVMSDITGDIGHIFGGSANTAPGSQGLSDLSSSSTGDSDMGDNSVPGAAASQIPGSANDDEGEYEDEGEAVGASVPFFS